MIIHPSSPLQALRAALPNAQIDYVDGKDRAAAARAAKAADVAIVFATQWATESVDLPDMRLPDNQDALIEAVAKANPKPPWYWKPTGRCACRGPSACRRCCKRGIRASVAARRSPIC